MHCGSFVTVTILTGTIVSIFVSALPAQSVVHQLERRGRGLYVGCVEKCRKDRNDSGGEILQVTIISRSTRVEMDAYHSARMRKHPFTFSAQFPSCGKVCEPEYFKNEDEATTKEGTEKQVQFWFCVDLCMSIGKRTPLIVWPSSPCQSREIQIRFPLR